MGHLKTVVLAGACALVATPASAATLRVTVESAAPINGLSLTPVFAAVHNGGFDAFTAGSPASAGVELVAEVGVNGTALTELQAADANAVAVDVAAAGNGVPPIEPGETGSTTIKVNDPTQQRFFTFLSMIIPSNDTFVGNDTATAFELFDASGVFNGPLSIAITADFIYDAGTEVNDPNDGPAFAAGQAGGAGTPENGVITQGVFDLANFAGIETATGAFLDAGAIDFANNPDFVIATLTVEQVPLPATAAMLLGGLGMFGFVARRRGGATA